MNLAWEARGQSRHERSPHPEGSLASHLRLCPRLRPKGCIFALRAEPPPAGKRKEPRHEPEPPRPHYRLRPAARRSRWRAARRRPGGGGGRQADRAVLEREPLRTLDRKSVV